MSSKLKHPREKSPTSNIYKFQGRTLVGQIGYKNVMCLFFWPSTEGI